MGAPVDFSRLTRVLRDQNNNLLSGRLVEAKAVAIVNGSRPNYTLTESTNKPGVYSNPQVECGREYNIYVDGDLFAEWQSVPFGSGVGRDRIFLNEHDRLGAHTDITCTTLTFV